MLNKAILMGRLVAEPELRHTPNSVPVLSFTIAVDRAYAKDGKRETDFIDVVAWRTTAEFISKYFRKGQLIAISGSIQTRNWEDKDGKKRKSVEVIADEAHFAEPKRQSDNSDFSGYSAAAASSGYGAPLVSASMPDDNGSQLTSGSDFYESDDDGELPF